MDGQAPQTAAQIRAASLPVIAHLTGSVLYPKMFGNALKSVVGQYEAVLLFGRNGNHPIPHLLKRCPSIIVLRPLDRVEMVRVAVIFDGKPRLWPASIYRKMRPLVHRTYPAVDVDTVIEARLGHRIATHSTRQGQTQCEHELPRRSRALDCEPRRAQGFLCARCAMLNGLFQICRDFGKGGQRPRWEERTAQRGVNRIAGTHLAYQPCQRQGVKARCLVQNNVLRGAQEQTGLDTDKGVFRQRFARLMLNAGVSLPAGNIPGHQHMHGKCNSLERSVFSKPRRYQGGESARYETNGVAPGRGRTQRDDRRTLKLHRPSTQSRVPTFRTIANDSNHMVELTRRREAEDGVHTLSICARPFPRFRILQASFACFRPIPPRYGGSC